MLVQDAENVQITGRGTIDGQGDYWWQFYEAPDDEIPDSLAERLAEFHGQNDKSDDVSSFTLRPPLCRIDSSENVSVSGVTLRNSPFWNTHVVYSDDVTLHDVNVENPADAPNGDGIDIDSSRHVRISDSYLNAGDDAVCIKSGKDEEGREVGRPAAQITVTKLTHPTQIQPGIAIDIRRRFRPSSVTVPSPAVTPLRIGTVSETPTFPCRSGSRDSASWGVHDASVVWILFLS